MVDTPDTPAPDPDDEYISEAEAARLLSVDVRTLAARGPSYGLTPYQPLGIARRKYKRADVLAYIASITAKPSTPTDGGSAA